MLGATHLGDLVGDFNGSYIMSFAAYNAGKSRVVQWVKQYGDPRDPNVDAIDWIERIPFTETRNYVQRCTENLQVYRARFGSREPALVIQPRPASRRQSNSELLARSRAMNVNGIASHRRR